MGKTSDMKADMTAIENAKVTSSKDRKASEKTKTSKGK